MKAIDWAYRYRFILLNWNSMQQVSSMYRYIIMTFFLFLAVLFFSPNKGIPDRFVSASFGIVSLHQGKSKF